MEEKIQRLSEGYDFIEESCGYAPLSFEENTQSGINESATATSPYKIIGRASGPFQPVGAMSRNNRRYADDHWQIQLENLNFQDRLKSRGMFGCIGHEDKRVDDKDIAAGKVSHIVTCLEIREDENGMPFLYGAMDILDTPTGRILKAMYDGGANLYVSSRGAGKLLPVAGESYKLVDKNSYYCETFDVVMRPGFLKAKPLYEGIKETSESVNESAVNTQPVIETKSEIKALNEQVQKLASIMERVVTDIYEVPVKKPTITEEERISLISAIGLIMEADINDEARMDVLNSIEKYMETNYTWN